MLDQNWIWNQKLKRSNKQTNKQAYVPFRIIAIDFTILIPTRIPRTVHFCLDRSPLFSHSSNEFMKSRHFLFRPRAALEGMELPETMPIDTLNRTMRNTLGNFHPSALEFCLVVTFTTKTWHVDLFSSTVFFHGCTDRFAFLATKLSVTTKRKRVYENETPQSEYIQVCIARNRGKISNAPSMRAKSKSHHAVSRRTQRISRTYPRSRSTDCP